MNEVGIRSTSLSKENLRELVDNEFEISYNYREVDSIKDGSLGTAGILFRDITVVKNMSTHETQDKYLYVIVLTHEIMHLKYFTGDERYTTYKTFKELYESDNPVLKEMGLYQAWLIITRFYPEEYYCGDQIYNQLSKDGYNIRRIN